MLLGVPPGNLDGILDCLRATVAEEEAGQLLRADLSQLVKKCNLQQMSSLSKGRQGPAVHNVRTLKASMHLDCMKNFAGR